jgi:hypothetical protein
MAPTKSDRHVREQLSELAREVAGSGSSHLERAAALLRIAEAADRLARAEVTAARAQDGASWADVGEALGVSRQTAHERYRSGPDGGASRLTNRPAS